MVKYRKQHHLLKGRRLVQDQLLHVVDDHVSYHCWLDIHHRSLTSDRKFGLDPDELLQKNTNLLAMLIIKVSTSIICKEMHTIIFGCVFLVPTTTCRCTCQSRLSSILPSIEGRQTALALNAQVSVTFQLFTDMCYAGLRYLNTLHCFWYM